MLLDFREYVPAQLGVLVAVFDGCKILYQTSVSRCLPAWQGGLTAWMSCIVDNISKMHSMRTFLSRSELSDRRIVLRLLNMPVRSLSKNQHMFAWGLPAMIGSRFSRKSLRNKRNSSCSEALSTGSSRRRGCRRPSMENNVDKYSFSIVIL